jgi:hypothetical protein
VSGGQVLGRWFVDAEMVDVIDEAHKDLSKQKAAPCFARQHGVIMSRKFLGKAQEKLLVVAVVLYVGLL